MNEPGFSNTRVMHVAKFPTQAKIATPLVMFANLMLADSAFASPTATSSNAWAPLTKDQNVVVEILKRDGQEPLIRGTLIFSHSIESLRKTLMDVSNYTDWLPDTAVWQIVSKSNDAVFIYARHNLAWPMKDRDYRVRYSFKDLPSNGLRVSARATTAKGPKPIDGVIRLKNVRSDWMVTSLAKGKTRVQYTYDGSLGGDLPDFVKRSAWKHEPVSLLRALHNWLDATTR